MDFYYDTMVIMVKLSLAVLATVAMIFDEDFYSFALKKKFPSYSNKSLNEFSFSTFDDIMLKIPLLKKKIFKECGHQMNLAMQNNPNFLSSE